MNKEIYAVQRWSESLGDWMTIHKTYLLPEAEGYFDISVAQLPHFKWRIVAQRVYMEN